MSERSERRMCRREGCPRSVPQKRMDDTCSILCGLVARELDTAQHVCESIGDAEHWPAAVALNDALTAFRESDTRVYRAARAVGITNDQWVAIKRG